MVLPYFPCNLDSIMQKLHMKYSKSPMQKNPCRIRAGSLGDILINSHKALQGPSLTAKSPYSRTNRSMSICTPGIHGYGGINQARRNSKNDSVNSLGEHFSSLLSLSSQVNTSLNFLFTFNFATNIEEKIAPRSNSLTANDLTDILLVQIRKSFRERYVQQMISGTEL